MAISRKNESRLLSQEERDLVDRTRVDKLRDASDADIATLVTELRERRKRARNIASRQNREMRGKAESAGRTAATRSDGTHRKAEVLASAVKRVNNERVRRAKASATPSQAALARRALNLKRAAAEFNQTPAHRTANAGMQPIENETFEDLSRRSEIGRVTKFVAAAQSKRDNR